MIWEVNGQKRVLSTKIGMRAKTLILLHASNGPVSESDLVAWIEHSNASVYRREVLRPAHRERLVEYDPNARTVEISPLGVAHVEEAILPSLDV